MNYLRVKNWDSFQHYKDRNPPWIKLHRSLLDDYEFCGLRDVVKGQLMLIWLFASQNEGKIPHDAKFLERKLGLTERCALSEMVQTGFLIPEHDASSSASTALADCKQPDSRPLALARSREERQRTKATEAETDAGAFNRFWQAYPRKVAKPIAAKAWDKAGLTEFDLPAILAAVERGKASPQWQKDRGEFIPHPSTWLNQRRWEDSAPLINGHHDMAVDPDLADLLQREARKHMVTQ
jgi:hypothetical protein